MVLLAIPVATFGRVDRESEALVDAGVHVYQKWSQMCSIGFKSGDLEDHGRTLMLVCSR